MAVYQCSLCDELYDEDKEETPFADLPDDWVCPVCASPKSYFNLVEDASPPSDIASGAAPAPESPSAPKGGPENWIADIQAMAATGQSIFEPMRTALPAVSWDSILIKGAQLARFPLNSDEAVSTRTVIGPRARQPLTIETPILVSHMSFGALSREVKIALARGAAAAGAAIGSGEGGILPEEQAAAHRYIYEYVPNRYSVTDENLRNADAIEIKIGQSSKPGMGGHLPGTKVTSEIAAVRGKPLGEDIHSPSRFNDINSADDLKEKVAWLREKSGGRPLGVKIAAGNIEADLEVALHAEPDFVTIDGRPGATGAAPKFVKAATSVPTVFALHRARKFLDEKGAASVSLVITGGLRVSSDFAKALAMGADAVAIATSALIACGCQQYRACHADRCPVGVCTQDPKLRERLDIDRAAHGLENFLSVCTRELEMFARLTGRSDVHDLSVDDLCAVDSEISGHTSIRHA